MAAAVTLCEAVAGNPVHTHHCERGRAGFCALDVAHDCTIPPHAAKLLRALAIECCEVAKDARIELDRAVDALAAARVAADAALERCRAAALLAHRMTAFAARAIAGDVDPETMLLAERAIRELVQ